MLFDNSGVGGAKPLAPKPLLVLGGPRCCVSPLCQHSLPILPHNVHGRHKIIIPFRLTSQQFPVMICLLVNYLSSAGRRRSQLQNLMLFLFFNFKVVALRTWPKSIAFK